MKVLCRNAALAFFALLAGLQLVLPRSHMASQPQREWRFVESRGSALGDAPREADAVYTPDPAHLWNRLHRHFHTRRASDGQAFGGDGLDPLLWYETRHLLDGPSHAEAVALLDEFLAARAERLITDPLKRATLQRDLWAVFDWLSARGDNYFAQRRQLQVRLGSIIHRLALTAEQIKALPDNYARAVAERAFPPAYQTENPEAAFLPADIFQPEGPWVCLGNGQGPLLARTHTEAFNGRSAFLVFMRLPGGRRETVEYLARLKDFPQPLIPNTEGSSVLGPVRFNPELPQFPVGTQLALIRQQILIDDEGRLVPSRLTESVQIRVYREISGVADPYVINAARAARHTQATHKFVLSRSGLFAGVTGGLRPVSPEEKEFAVFMARGIDWFEQLTQEGGPERVREDVLGSCIVCHAAPGVHSMLSYTRGRFSTQGLQPPDIVPADPTGEASNTTLWKADQFNWGLLQGIWAQPEPRALHAKRASR